MVGLTLVVVTQIKRVVYIYFALWDLSTFWKVPMFLPWDPLMVGFGGIKALRLLRLCILAKSSIVVVIKYLWCKVCF